MRAALILVGVLLGRDVAAQALDEAPAGAAGLALAGAGVAGLHQPAAIWINPALLLDARPHLAVELRLWSHAARLTSTTVVNQELSGRDLEGSHLWPAVAVAHPLGLRWLWAGLAYRLARQARSRYPSGTTPARYLGRELSLEQHAIAAGLCAGLRRVAIGATVELSHLVLLHHRAMWAGTEDDRRRLLEDARLDVDAELQASNRVAATASFGAWARPLRWLELGAAVRLPVRTTLRGEVALRTGTGRPSGVSSIQARGGAATLRLTLPLEVRGGVALGPPRWRVLAEARYHRWSAADQPTAELQDAALLVMPVGRALAEHPIEELPLGIYLRDSFSGHGALELVPWSDRLVLRLGYAFHRGATRPALPSPVLLDLDRHVIGAGVQVQAGRLIMAVAFAHSFEAELQVDENLLELGNPLDPAVTAAIGAGSYRCSRVQVVFEAGIDW